MNVQINFNKEFILVHPKTQNRTLSPTSLWDLEYTSLPGSHTTFNVFLTFFLLYIYEIFALTFLLASSKTNGKGNWRDNSAVKRTCCSSQGPEFKAQHTGRVAQKHLQLQLQRVQHSFLTFGAPTFPGHTLKKKHIFKNLKKKLKSLKNLLIGLGCLTQYWSAYVSNLLVFLDLFIHNRKKENVSRTPCRVAETRPWVQTPAQQERVGEAREMINIF